MSIEKRIEFDPCDWEGMFDLMEKHGDSDMMMYGENEDGEDVSVSVYKDRIIVDTVQQNGWIRRNIYWRDYTVEELYSKSGKW